jgi:integrase
LGARKQRPNDLYVQLIAQDNQRQRIDPSIMEKAEDLLRHSLATNTERAYESDLRHFRDWGGLLPASPDTICAYIAAHAGALSVATIQRRIATLSKAHEAAGLINPCRAEVTKATLRGLKRKHGTAQRQAKPLMRDDLFLVLDRLGSTLRDQRDRALLLLGFAGGFRRSELVALELADIETARQGLIVTIRRSKTDQEGAGRRIGIPHGRTRYCPVAAVEAWLAASAINTGPLFRPMTRHGKMAANPLTGDAVSVLLRERLQGAGIDPKNYSGHSLRAGFATSAAQAGVSTPKIRQQTGHASDTMLARYVRDGELATGGLTSLVERNLDEDFVPQGDSREEATDLLLRECSRAVQDIGHQALGSEVSDMAPQDRLARVIRLSQARAAQIEVGSAGIVHHQFAGPHHLATLLARLIDGVREAMLVRLPTPSGAQEKAWLGWLLSQAPARPFLWVNHMNAVSTGYLNRGKSMVMTSPTGSGKTTLSVLKIAATLCAGESVVYLAPTHALVDQVEADMSTQIGGLEAVSVVEDVAVEELGDKLPPFSVMTPERCLALMGMKPDLFDRVGLLVFDEFHLISADDPAISVRIRITPTPTTHGGISPA